MFDVEAAPEARARRELQPAARGRRRGKGTDLSMGCRAQ